MKEINDIIKSTSDLHDKMSIDDLLVYDNTIRENITKLYLSLIVKKILNDISGTINAGDVIENIFKMYYVNIEIQINENFYLFLKLYIAKQFDLIFVDSYAHDINVVKLHKQGFLTDEEFKQHRVIKYMTNDNDTSVAHMLSKYKNIEDLINDIRTSIVLLRKSFKSQK
jgi:hypothetical protein